MNPKSIARKDCRLSAEQLREKYQYYPNYGHPPEEGQHPLFTIADWIAAVSNWQTRLGYWAWVEHCLAGVES